MKRLKNITILLCFLSLFAFISCSAEDKMGGKTPPGGETETPPSEPETIEEIDAEGFPPELFGTYRDERIYNKFKDERDDAKVSLSGQEIWMRGTQMFNKEDGSTGTQSMDSKIKKWKKTTKGGKIIKLEGESFSTKYDFDTGETTTVAKTVIIYDYENKTVSMTFTASTYTPDGVDASFYGKKIN